MCEGFAVVLLIMMAAAKLCGRRLFYIGSDKAKYDNAWFGALLEEE